MFTVTHKLRAVITIGIASAALGTSGAASAATVFHKPGTTPIVVSHPVVTVRAMIDPEKVGSAGIPGYDDSECRELAITFNTAEANLNKDVAGGNKAAAADDTEAGLQASQELHDNCMVID